MLSPSDAFARNDNNIKVRRECSENKEQTEDKQIVDSSIIAKDRIKTVAIAEGKGFKSSIFVKVH